MSIFKSVLSSLLNEGGQAAENLIAQLAKDTNNTSLKYTRALPTKEVVYEVQQLLKILRSKNLIDRREPSYYLGSSRLFAIKAGLRVPEPDEIESQEIINKALQTKKDFGDIDLDVYFAAGVTTKDIGNFLNSYKGKYAAAVGGDEINTAVVVDGTNNVIQIDIVNIEGREQYFGMSQYASMADMSVGIKGVVRALLIRSIAATNPIDVKTTEYLDNLIKDTDAYKNLVAKYSPQEIDYDLRYTLGGDGLAYRINWLVDGVSRNYSKGGVKFDQLQRFVSNQAVTPVAYEDIETLGAVLGFKNPQHMKHVVKMAELVSTFDDERKQSIWNALVKNLKTKTPTATRTQGQISTAEAANALKYLKPYFGDIDFSEASEFMGEMTEAVKMTSIPHIDQMTPKDFCNLFNGGAWEVSEKYDGSNVSFGLLDGEIFVKSKKGNPVTNEQDFIDMAEKFDNDIFLGFARLLAALKKSDFKSLISGIESSLDSQVQIFGEMFSKPHMNVIPYAVDKIGNGAIVIFGVVKLNSPKGTDITTTEDGQAIKDQIVEEVNGVDGWIFYSKKPLSLEVTDEIKTQIQRVCGTENMAIIASRKRTGTEAEMKAKSLSEFRTLQALIKKEMLGGVANIPSSLGAEEIEGAIIRNMQTGAIAKLVDLEGFGRRRAEQWAGVDALKNYRKSLFNNLKEDVLKNADIFILDDKQVQKLSDAVETRGSRFTSLDDMIDILYGDAADEVQFEEASKMVADLSNTLKQYQKDIEGALTQINKDDAKAYQDTQKAITSEKTRIDQFIIELNKRILNNQNPYLSVIAFILGPRSIDDLKKKFMTAVK